MLYRIESKEKGPIPTPVETQFRTAACYSAYSGPVETHPNLKLPTEHGRVVKGRQSLLTGDPQGRGFDSERGRARFRCQVRLRATGRKLVSLITLLEKGEYYFLSFFLQGV